jgi:cellobiose-specific phosphotransferase system component IIB
MKRILILSLAIALMVAAGSQAGYIIKETSTSETQSPMGAPETTTSTDEIYLEKNKIKEHNGEVNQSTIVDFENKVLYMIDHDQKTYQEMRFSDIESSSKGMIAAQKQEMEEALKNMPEEQRAMAKNMMSGLFTPIQVEKTGKTKDILGHKCYQYIASRQGKKFMELWATDEADFDYKFSDYMKYVSPDMAQYYEEMDKIEGIPLETITTMDMGMMQSKSHSIATEFKKTDIDDSQFRVPEGYTKVESDLDKYMKQQER